MGFLLSSVLHADRIVTSFHTKFTIHWPLESPSSVNRTILPARSHYLQNPGRPVLCHFPFYLTKSVRSPFASNPARPCFGSRDAANSGSRESPSPHFGTEREREREREREGGGASATMTGDTRSLSSTLVCTLDSLVTSVALAPSVVTAARFGCEFSRMRYGSTTGINDRSSSIHASVPREKRAFLCRATRRLSFA